MQSTTFCKELWLRHNHSPLTLISRLNSSPKSLRLSVRRFSLFRWCYFRETSTHLKSSHKSFLFYYFSWGFLSHIKEIIVYKKTAVTCSQMMLSSVAADLLSLDLTLFCPKFAHWRCPDMLCLFSLLYLLYFYLSDEHSSLWKMGRNTSYGKKIL